MCVREEILLKLQAVLNSDAAQHEKFKTYHKIIMKDNNIDDTYVLILVYHALSRAAHMIGVNYKLRYIYKENENEMYALADQFRES